jgi:hypothetical protein
MKEEFNIHTHHSRFIPEGLAEVSETNPQTILRSAIHPNEAKLVLWEPTTDISMFIITISLLMSSLLGQRPAL